VVRFIARHPWRTMLLALALAATSAAGVTRARADFTHKAYFWDDDVHLQRFESFERRFGNDDAVVVAVHSPSGMFDLDSARLLQTLTERMWKVPEVIRVDSLANYNWVHARGDDIVVEPLLPEQLTPEVLQERRQIALHHEILPDYLVSRDGRTALLFARIKPGIDRPPNAPLITHTVEALAAELRRTDHQLYVSGGPPTNAAFKEIATRDLGRLFPLALLTATIFLLLILRSLAGVLIPLSVVFLSLLSSFGFAGWAGIPLTNMSTVIPSIMIAIGIADSVHVLVTYYQARRDGHPWRDAARYSLEKNFLPTFLTSATTAVGFVTFVSANLKPVSGLGFMAAFGTMLAWVMTYSLLGPLLFLRPLRVRAAAGRQTGPRAEGLARRYTAFLVRHRRLVLLGAAVVAVGSLAVASTNQVNSDPMKYFRAHVPVRVANEFIERNVGGVRSLELVVESGREDGVKDPAFLARVEALQAWVQAQPGTTRAVSLIDVIKQTNRSLHGDQPQFYRIPGDRESIAQQLFLYTMNLPQGMDLNDRVTMRNDALRISVLTSITTSRELVAFLERIEQQGKVLGLDLRGTGKYSLYQRINGYVVNSFVSSFGQSVLFIGLLMVVFLRSIPLGLIAMIPNVLPVLIGGAFLRAIGQPLDLGTVLVASVCLGIAVDDTVHVMANFQRLRRQGESDLDAITSVFSSTAPALLSTTTILVITFATFAFADFTPNVFFGVLTSLILAIALLIDMVLTPVLLVRPAARARRVALAASA
jgi:predicted RND superfamily exporter protein